MMLPVLLLVAWEAVIIAVTWAPVDLVMKQWETLRYQPVTARVEKFWIEEKGKRRIPRVQYVYTLNGIAYEGNVIRPGPTRLLSRNAAEVDALEERFASGTQVTAYVNPANPGDAVLVPGATADAWADVLSRLPFHIATLYWLALALWYSRKALFVCSTIPGGYRIRQYPGAVLCTFLGAWALCCFGCTLVNAAFAADLAMVLWGPVVAAAPALAYTAWREWTMTQAFDIVVDTKMGTIAVPLWTDFSTRPERATLYLYNIKSIQVHPAQYSGVFDTDGYEVMLMMEGTPAIRRIGPASSLEKAENAAMWLAERCGIPFRRVAIAPMPDEEGGEQDFEEDDDEDTANERGKPGKQS
ncbi:hypothetical protein DB346_22345 [Verrucomicrobia bacterium LW23]|nr:hypothetical protein DB346_22345 [Verrucomicrobia bacterium LW23]